VVAGAFVGAVAGPQHEGAASSQQQVQARDRNLSSRPPKHPADATSAPKRNDTAKVTPMTPNARRIFNILPSKEIKSPADYSILLSFRKGSILTIRLTSMNSTGNLVAEKSVIPVLVSPVLMAERLALGEAHGLQPVSF
jgi:hypothetical protein